MLALLLSFVPTTFASASMLIEANYGLNGAGKMYNPISASIKVTNNGEAFEGYFVAGYEESGQLKTAQVYPIKLKAGQSETLDFYLNSYPDQLYYNNGKPLFTMYEGELDNNKIIKDIEIKNVKPRLYDAETIIVSTLNDETLLNILQKMRSESNVQLVPFALAELPEDSQALSMIDVLAVDEAKLATLTTAEQQVIEGWIQQGGRLLTDATLEDTVFQKQAPIQFTTGETAIQAEQLEKFTGNSVFTAGVQLKNATSKPMTQVFKQQDILLAASRKVEQGQLIQTTFALKDTDFSQMDGYKAVLAKVSGIQTLQHNFYPSTQHDMIASNLAYTNELFESFAFSLGKIIIVFSLYILLIGPLLYTFLKKKDKREHAWWIIPVVSIAFSLGLFLIGGKERLFKTQVQEMGLIKIGEEQTEQYFTQSILAQKAGDYQFNLEGNTTASAYETGFLVNDIAQWSYSRPREEGSEIVLKNVPYWGVKTIVGHSEEPTSGQFEQDLRVENKQLRGTIKNNLLYDVENVQIWTGTEMIALGNLAQGEQLDINEPLARGILLSISTSKMMYEMPQIQVKELENERKKRLYTLAESVLANEKKPVILAEVKNVKLTSELQQKANVKSTILVVQSFNANVQNSGTFTLENEEMKRQLKYGDAKRYADNLDASVTEWYFENGSYELTYELPLDVIQGAKWQEITVELLDEYMGMQIYNVETDNFEDMSTRKTILSNPDLYITSEGIITFKLDYQQGEQGQQALLPRVSLKGAMSK